MELLNTKKTVILLSIISLLLPTLGTAGGFRWFGNIPTLNLPSERRPAESSQRNEAMSVDSAKKMVNQYMEERFTNSYKIGEIEDRGTYYAAEILGSDSNAKEVLVIDKQTKEIQPLK